MTKELVTVVRYRVVVEEVVIPRTQFDQLNNVGTEDDYEAVCEYDQACLDRMELIADLPFEDAGFDGGVFLPDPDGYVVFSGDVTDHTDDLVGVVGSDAWQDLPPFKVDGEGYFEKIRRRASQAG
jgi:hypothetical protein